MRFCITYCHGEDKEHSAMATLTVTARGQVTFRKDILRHLGIHAGDRVRIELLPDGRVQLEADRPKETWHSLQGFLHGKTNGARLSIEDINAVIAEAGGVAGTNHD
jgi:bifunctional DNA-binding transcriptional regulator/antitoxin component of YhaV-PrlF toxin-antitoxin module